MITTEQKKEIRSYLLSKNIPLDIIMEMRDHIYQQIDVDINLENLSFQEAFLKMKEDWQADLFMVRKSFFSFGKVPRIVKDIQNIHVKKNVKKASMITFNLVLAQLFSASFFEMQLYYILNSLLYLFIGFSIIEAFLRYLFSSIRLKRTRVEQFFYSQFFVFILLYVLLHFIGVFTKLPSNPLKIIYSFVNGIHTYSPVYFLAVVLGFTFKTGSVIYFLGIFKDRSKAIKKIEKYYFTND